MPLPVICSARPIRSNDRICEHWQSILYRPRAAYLSHRPNERPKHRGCRHIGLVWYETYMTTTAMLTMSTSCGRQASMDTRRRSSNELIRTTSRPFVSKASRACVTADHSNDFTQSISLTRYRYWTKMLSLSWTRHCLCTQYFTYWQQFCSYCPQLYCGLWGRYF